MTTFLDWLPAIVFALCWLIPSAVAWVDLRNERRIKAARAECNRRTIAHIEAVRRG